MERVRIEKASASYSDEQHELAEVDAAVAVRVAEGDDLPHLRPEQRQAHACEGIEQLVLVQLPAAVLVDRLPSIFLSAAVGRQEAQA